MKKFIITEEQHRLIFDKSKSHKSKICIFEHVSPEDLQKIKNMLVSPDKNNVDLAIQMLISFGYSLWRFIINWFPNSKPLPDLLIQGMTKSDLERVFKSGFKLSDEQITKFSDNEDVIIPFLKAGNKLWLSQRGPLTYANIFDTEKMDRINSAYYKYRIQKEIENLKSGDDGYESFYDDDLAGFSKEQYYLIGKFGFTFSESSLKFIMKRSNEGLDQRGILDAYKRGLFKFLENGGVIDHYEILEYFNVDEMRKYIELKGNNLDAKEIRMLSDEILRVYLEDRMKKVMASGGQLENQEEDVIDNYSDLNDKYNEYLER